MQFSSCIVDGLVTFSHLVDINEVPVSAYGPIMLAMETTLAVKCCFGIDFCNMVDIP